MTKKVLFIIESSDVGATYTAEATRALGFHPVFIVTMSHYQADTKAQIEQYDWRECADTTQNDSLLAAIEAAKLTFDVDDEVVGVTTLLDSRLGVVAEVAETLGVKGLDPAIAMLSDKGKVAKLLPEFHPQSRLFKRETLPEVDISAWLAEGKSVIVKPVHSAGALGMFELTDLSQLDAQMVENTKDAPKLLNEEWVAQEKIEGQLVSFEGFVLGGVPTFLGATAREKVEKTESICQFPYPLPPEVQEKAQRAIAAMVERSGFRSGYFHTEFMVDLEAKDCFMIDANVGRIGGGGISQQVAEAYQVSPVDVFKHVLQVGLLRGEGGDPGLYSKKPVNTLSVNYGIEQEAALQNVTLPDGACMHTLLLSPPATVPAMGVNNWAWLGIVVGREELVLTFVDRISVMTAQGAVKPFYLHGKYEETTTAQQVAFWRSAPAAEIGEHVDPRSTAVMKFA